MQVFVNISSKVAFILKSYVRQPSRVRSSFPEQGVTSYSSYTLQRCVTLPMRDQLLVAQPGVLSRPQFHDVGPSSWSKPITAPFATSHASLVYTMPT